MEVIENWTTIWTCGQWNNLELIQEVTATICELIVTNCFKLIVTICEWISLTVHNLDVGDWKGVLKQSLYILLMPWSFILINNASTWDKVNYR